MLVGHLEPSLRLQDEQSCRDDWRKKHRFLRPHSAVKQSSNMYQRATRSLIRRLPASDPALGSHKQDACWC